jgi:hypothetical protein
MQDAEFSEVGIDNAAAQAIGRAVPMSEDFRLVGEAFHDPSLDHRSPAESSGGSSGGGQ